MNPAKAMPGGRRNGNDRGIRCWILAAGLWLCGVGLLLLIYDIWFFVFEI